MKLILTILVAFVIGYVVGYVVGVSFMSARYFAGHLYVNTTDPEKDVYRLAVSDFNKLHERKLVIFKIVDTSQKQQGL